MAVIIFVGVAGLGYYIIEPGYSWLDAFYMTIISITTAGHLEVGGPLTAGGRSWTIFVLIGGITIGAVALSLIVAAVVEGRIRGILGRRQLERRISSLSGHIIVCGYGRMGQRVASLLKSGDRQVVVIDNSPDRTAQAEHEGTLYILGDAQEEEVLLSAGVQQADTLVATLADDASNVFLTLSARGLNKQMQIIARAQQAATQDKLTKAGATRVICPMIIGSKRIADVLLRPAMVDFVEMAHKGVDLEMDQLVVQEGSGITGRTLRDLALPSRVGATVVAIRRPDGTALHNPGPEVKPAVGDTMVLIGKHGMNEAIEKLQQPSDI
ncbi:MAG: potassium channel protein [Planctomycetota bacterium]|nr:potassium channel protein [Planctomycetota bacterium]